MPTVPSITDPDEQKPYRVEAAGSVFNVVDLAGDVVLASGDEASAEQYAVLMNQAYRRGYKAGYRRANK
jgi:hypothetical protein